MKSVVAAVAASILAVIVSSPVRASGDCVADGYDRGSPDVFKFVKWEFGKPDADGDLELDLTIHNMLDKSFTWLELDMLVDGKTISLNTEQAVPAASDTVLIAKYGMPKRDADRFQPLTPLICVSATEDEDGNRQNYE
ncbi:MAG: hypothetical protein KDJ88_06520 [Bauldia sp.]|nr:hypothetical protein [Bauldia sp.]